MTHAPSRFPAYLALVAAFLLWSNSFIAARLLVGEEVPDAQRLEPFGFVVARFVPVALFCGLWFLLRRSSRREASRALREAWPLVLLLAFVNVWGYNLAFAAGQHLVPPGTASLVITLNPVLTFLLALAIRQERFSALRALGLAVALAGVWVVITRGAGREITGAYLEDAALLVLAPISWALYTVLGKGLLVERDPLDLTFLVVGIGSLPALGLVALRPSLLAEVGSWDGIRYGSALFLGLGCSVVGYGLWFLALARVPATVAAAFVFLNPPLTLIFEWLWLGNVPSAGLIGGGVLVLLGVWLCTRRRGGAPPTTFDEGDPT